MGSGHVATDALGGKCGPHIPNLGWSGAMVSEEELRTIWRAIDAVKDEALRAAATDALEQIIPVRRWPDYIAR